MGPADWFGVLVERMTTCGASNPASETDRGSANIHGDPKSAGAPTAKVPMVRDAMARVRVEHGTLGLALMWTQGQGDIWRDSTPCVAPLSSPASAVSHV